MLLTWYCATVSGSHAHKTCCTFVRDFYLALMAFYLFTLTWDLLFRGATRNSGRVVPDLASLSIVSAAYLTHTLSYPNYIAIVLGALWFCIRALPWRSVVPADSAVKAR